MLKDEISSTLSVVFFYLDYQEHKLSTFGVCLIGSSAGNYDGIQTAKFMNNVVIINADNALNPRVPGHFAERHFADGRFAERTTCRK